jgi:hypothetical protein
MAAKARRLIMDGSRFRMDPIGQVYAQKQRVCDYRPENQSGGQWLSGNIGAAMISAALWATSLYF